MSLLDQYIVGLWGLENERFRLGERCLQTGRKKGVDWEFSGMFQVFSGRQKIF